MNKGLRSACIDSAVLLCRARFTTLPPYLNDLRKAYIKTTARFTIDNLGLADDIGDYDSLVADITNRLNEGGTLVRP